MHVAQSAFGGEPLPCHKKIFLLDGDVAVPTNRNRSNASAQGFVSACKYGLVSAVGGQVHGVAALVADDEESEAANITVVQTFDDASMWVSDPATKSERLAGTRSEGVKIAGGKL